MTELDLLQIIEEGGEKKENLLRPAIRSAGKVGLIPKFGSEEEKEKYWVQIETVLKDFLTEAWRYSDLFEK